MLTPRFELSQDENHLVIKIRAPYCSLRDLDVSADENEFLFTCKPYYLRLNLPGNVVENDATTSKFDADTGEFTFCYEKQNPGEEFTDLEFITKFLVSKVHFNEGDRKLTILASEDPNQTETRGYQDEHSDLDLDYNFGFALQGHKDFIRVSAEFDEVFEINPAEVNLQERRKLRLQYEQGRFNADHYLLDFIEDDTIKKIISAESPWKHKKIEDTEFSANELDFLKNLSNVEYNLSEKQIVYAHNSLIDILYAYCYDQRTTEFEGNIESGWTIVKIASSLCWLDVFETPKEVLTCSFRRSLIYPLYRNFNINKQVLEDLLDLIRLGEKYIIKCLIQMYYIFLKGDCCRYILNNLFIKDYITYIMKWDKTLWQDTIDKLKTISIDKKDLGLNLNELEESIVEEKLGNLHLSYSDTDDDSDDDSDSSEEDSDDSTDDSDTAPAQDSECEQKT